MEDIIKVLKALSDESRLRMLMLIEQQELCVCEIMEILGMGQSRVSRHLAILNDAGLAKSRRQGTWMFFKSAGKETTSYHSDIVKTLTNWMKDRGIIKDDLRNMEKCLAKRGKEGHCPKL